MSFLPVRLLTLKHDIVLGFDLYLQLPHKIIKYVNENDSITELQIKMLKEKKVRKLYLLESDEVKYQNYMDRCLTETINDSRMNIHQKAEIIVNASEDSAEKIMGDPQSEKSYDTAKKIAYKLIESLSSSDEMLIGIFDQKIHDDDHDNMDVKMHKHAVNTSSICISFAEYLKFPSDVTHNLAVAGLFHDIAYGQFSDRDKLLFFKSLDQMIVEELKIYKEHPRIAAEILQDKKFASKEVIELIMSHEERQNGNGFPNKLSKLSLPQEVLALACYYDQRVTCFGEDRSDVIKDLAISQLGNFELDTINKFKKFIELAGLK